MINTPLAEAHYPVFSIDDHAGALAMTRHLLDAGHRRIAFIAGRAVLGESGEGCGLRWRALDTAMSTPAAACVAAGVAALNDFSVTADGGRVLFSSTRREQDIAVAALRPSR